MMHTNRRSADKLRKAAEQQAEKLLAPAREEAEGIVQEAEDEAERRRKRIGVRPEEFPFIVDNILPHVFQTT